MITNLDTEGLSKIAFDYDLFYIDIWGVIHNGLELNFSAVETLRHLKENKKEYVLLTNAPRPNEPVIKFLKKMGLKENFGNVFVESLAAGTPIVASLDTPWQISEFRKCGKWVNNDVSNIYSAIVDLLGEDRINIRNNCLKLSEEFDWSIIAFKFDEIYRKLSVKV